MNNSHAAFWSASPSTQENRSNGIESDPHLRGWYSQYILLWPVLSGIANTYCFGRCCLIRSGLVSFLCLVPDLGLCTSLRRHPGSPVCVLPSGQIWHCHVHTGAPWWKPICCLSWICLGLDSLKQIRAVRWMMAAMKNGWGQWSSFTPGFNFKDYILAPLLLITVPWWVCQPKGIIVHRFKYFCKVIKAM